MQGIFSDVSERGSPPSSVEDAFGDPPWVPETATAANSRHIAFFPTHAHLRSSLLSKVGTGRDAQPQLITG